MTLRVAYLTGAGAILGEGPVWDERAGQLYWIDIKAPAIHRLDPASGATRRWPMPAPIGSMALREAGGAVVALKTGFAIFDFDSGMLEPIAAPEADRPGNRMNDGKCDAQGRFWAGSMDDAETQPSGDLYRLDADRRVTRFPAGWICTNGLGWSGDGTRMYFTDTFGRTIHAYAFDAARGTLGAAAVFAQIPDGAGYPDGLCVDAEDHVWGAHWGGWRVTRYRPDGTVERVVELPVPNCTSCCFGGPGLDVLYVTSASIGLDAATREKAPLAGGLFAVTGLGVKGRPMARFAG